MDITEFLAKCLDEDQAAAEACAWKDWIPGSGLHGPSVETSKPQPGWYGERANVASLKATVGKDEREREHAAHIARHDPTRVLREVAGKRAILAEVTSWQHVYVDGDSWLSCAQAVDEHDEEQTPGSGCADDSRRGGPCECDLERRREAILRPLALAYSDRPGYQERWKL